MTQDEIDELWKEGYFGIDSGVQVQRALWWSLSIHCGWRGCDEDRQLLLMPPGIRAYLQVQFLIIAQFIREVCIKVRLQLGDFAYSRKEMRRTYFPS